MIRDVADTNNSAPMGMTLERQVTLGFAVALAMLLGLGFTSYNSINRFLFDSSWSRHTYDVLAAIHAMHDAVLDAESDTRAYVITGNRQYLDSDNRAIALLEPRLQTLKDLTADNPAQRRRIEVLRPALAKKIGVMQRQCRLRGGAAFDMGAAANAAAEGIDAGQYLRRTLTEMEAEESQLLARRRVETETSGQRALRLIMCGAVLMLILMAGAATIIHRTIAARTRSEDAVRASDAMFRGLLESAPDAMVIVNDKGQIEFFNAQAEKMFGYPAADLLGQPIDKIVPQHVQTGDGAIAAKLAADASGPDVHVARDLFGIRKGGAEFPIEISLGPLRTPNGLRVSSAIRDVTRRKQEEEALRNLNAALNARSAELEVANRELESFSYSVSHDLRAPLRSIDGFSQALLEDNGGKLDPDSEDNLRRVRAASQRMGDLIDDLLNLARVSRAEMNREEVDLSKIAREVADELKAGTPGSNAEIVIADGLMEHADARLLRVVLTNLLNNAWKFTATRSEPRIEFGAVQTDNGTEYFVRDNGVGFDMTYVGKLFGAFQRLHAATDFPGTGIGLATVQRIVHRHGGRVWADAELQAGATFHFTLAPPAQLTLAKAA